MHWGLWNWTLRVQHDQRNRTGTRWANLLDIEENGPTLFNKQRKDKTQNEEFEEVNTVNNLKILNKQENSTNQKNVRPRASCIFTLEDDIGSKQEYLGLLDAGSTKSLISEDLNTSVTNHDWFRSYQNY